MQLWDELVGPHDGTCHQLWEEADVEAEVEDVADGLDTLAVNIHDVADGLEGIERDTHRQHDYVDAKAVIARNLVAHPREDVENAKLKPCQVIDDIGDEIGVFEIKKDGQVDDDAEPKDGVAAAVFLSRVKPTSCEIVV